jgi:hypothetical protein
VVVFHRTLNFLVFPKFQFGCLHRPPSPTHSHTFKCNGQSPSTSHVFPPTLSRYYAYGSGSTATSNTERAQEAFLFFQVLTLVLSVTCASVCNALLCYLYYRPDTSYADAFADAVIMNVRLVFRLVLFSHVTYCCSLILIGFVYFPNDAFALNLTISVFGILLA